jgi:3-oxoacyl-[acyl-carrier protein] reductase
MDLGLKGKRALITGSSRGIGFHTARALAREGCAVAICSRQPDALEEAKHSLESFGVPVYSQVADLSEAGKSEEFVHKAAQALGSIDIVVCNAGGNIRKPFHEISHSQWQSLFNLNFFSGVETARAAYPWLRKARGKLVFISSIYGREFGGPEMAIYHTSKAALNALSKSLAVEWADQGICVNTVAPGSILFEGGSWDRRLKEKPEAMARFIEANLPRGSFGNVDELVDAIMFLVSERASLVSGTCWNVDGCQSRSIL